MNTNINIDSRHAVSAALVWKLPTLLTLGFFVCVFLSFVPTWKQNSRLEAEKFNAYTSLKAKCMRTQLEQFGRYDSVQCGRWANAYVPYYR